MDIVQYERGAAGRFERHEDGGVVWFDVPAISGSGRFVCAFTSRLGGVSPAPWDSLNLSRTREPSPANKRENFRRAAGAVGVDPASMALVNYEHGDGIVRLTARDAGKGFSREIDYPHCDALIAMEPGVTAVTLHADCVPVFVADPGRGRIAACHAGWKGTAKRLPGKLVAEFVSMGSAARDMLVAIGPHIRTCCFEVGDEIAEIFEREFGADTVDRCSYPKPHVSLERAILRQFAEAGIGPEQVSLSGDCTHCLQDLYYSHRRDRGATGAMGSFVAVREG